MVTLGRKALATFVACAASLGAAAVTAAPRETARMSVAAPDANQSSFEVSVSADGRFVAFSSSAWNLVLGDSNGSEDIFLSDRQTGILRRVSVSATGQQFPFLSFAPAISADGRLVAFASHAPLVPDDTNDLIDVYVYDAATGAIRRASASSLGEQADGQSLPSGYNGGDREHAFSGDGRLVVFESTAANLVLDDTNGVSDVFVHDLTTGTTARASVSSLGAEANGGSSGPVISADGRKVLFSSEASNLVPRDTNARTDVFVHDLVTGETSRVSLAKAREANGSSFTGSMSLDGRFVTFWSEASNLVRDDTNGVTDVFVRDMKRGTVSRVSASSAGAQADASSFTGSMSADGRSIAFLSWATNLVPGDTNGRLDAFVRDRDTGLTSRVSVSSIGQQQLGGEGFDLQLAASGTIVAFSSSASNLVPRDLNQATDVFLRDLLVGITTRASVVPDPQPNGASCCASVSADGRFVAFTSDASNLLPNDHNIWPDIFVSDRTEGTTALISVDPRGGSAGGPSFDPSISADGRFVAFASLAPNLVEYETNDVTDVFVRDLLTDTTTRVSVGLEGEANGASYDPVISADGSAVAFVSQASNLVPGDTNDLADIFVRDLRSRSILRASVSSTGTEANALSESPAISGDGSVVAFLSSASNLLEGDLNSCGEPLAIRSCLQVYVHDLGTGETMLVSVSSTGLPANRPSSSPAASADGRFIAFASDASNLAFPDTNGVSDVFVHDRIGRRTMLASVSLFLLPGDGGSFAPSMSADGRLVAFASEASNLVPGDTNGLRDIFVRDLTAGVTWLASVSSAGAHADGPSDAPAISGEGQLVAFVSSATNLVGDDRDGVTDVFAREL